MNKYISLALTVFCVTFSACNTPKTETQSTASTVPVVSTTTTVPTPVDTAATTPESNPEATATTSAKTETTKAPSTRVINGKAYTAKQLEQAIKTDESLEFEVTMKQSTDADFATWFIQGTNSSVKIDAQLAQSTIDYNKAKEEADASKAGADFLEGKKK
jgi:hypothetical protein